MQKLLKNQSLHWLAAIGYSVFILAYLLQQPGSLPVEIVAPVAAPNWQREIIFTIGHIIGFGVLFLLWYVALLSIAPVRAKIGAFVVAMVIGILAETLQNLLPGRNASLYDVVMNTIGMTAVWVGVRVWHVD
jgi:VanZ family protein